MILPKDDVSSATLFSSSNYSASPSSFLVPPHDENEMDIDEYKAIYGTSPEIFLLPRPISFKGLDRIKTEGMGNCFPISLINCLKIFKGEQTQYSYNKSEIRNIKLPYYLEIASLVSGISGNEIKRLYVAETSEQMTAMCEPGYRSRYSSHSNYRPSHKISIPENLITQKAGGQRTVCAPHSIFDLFANLDIMIMKNNEWLDVKSAKVFSRVYEINICIWMANAITGGYSPFFHDQAQMPYHCHVGAESTAHILYHVMGLNSNENSKGKSIHF
jgi:hypothetical protein